MRRHKLLSAAVLLTVLAFAPLISAALSGALSAAFGCDVGGGRAEACLVGGVDITPALVTMGLIGWWMLVSWLLLVPAAILWAALVVRWFVRRVRGIVTGAPDPRERA